MGDPSDKRAHTQMGDPGSVSVLGDGGRTVRTEPEGTFYDPDTLRPLRYTRTPSHKYTHSLTHTHTHMLHTHTHYTRTHTLHTHECAHAQTH